jgi:hypothetical protein
LPRTTAWLMRGPAPILLMLLILPPAAAPV